MHGHVANFIKEQRAALCLFKPANRLPHGSCKRALFMTKKFGFDELTWNCSHVNGYERSSLTMAKIVNGFGYQFFASSTLARNQNGQVIAQKPSHHAVNILHRSASPDHRNVGLGNRLKRLLRRGAPPFDSLLHCQDKIVQVKRLWKILKRINFAGAHRSF